MPDQKTQDGLNSRPPEADQGTKTPDTASAPVDQRTLYQRSRCLFSGSYTHGIDAKGRLIIPASFREELGTPFVIAPTPDFQAVALYPAQEWVRQEEKLEALADLDARAIRLINQFSKYSYKDSETDLQGRLLLPQKMRSKYLDNVRDVEISGAKTYIRIVSAEAGEEEDELFNKDFPDPLAFIAELQQRGRS